MKKPKGSGKQAAKKIIKKYDKIRHEKAYQMLVDTREKRKKQRKIEIVDEIKNVAAKKNTRIVAKKILGKYKRMERPKKTYLVDEEDIETLDFNEPQEDLFKGGSVIEAVNELFDFHKFKKEQTEALDDFKQKLVEDAETINYADALDINDLKENKNLKITAKKISDKYRKQRKR